MKGFEQRNQITAELVWLHLIIKCNLTIVLHDAYSTGTLVSMNKQYLYINLKGLATLHITEDNRLLLTDNPQSKMEKKKQFFMQQSCLESLSEALKRKMFLHSVEYGMIMQDSIIRQGQVNRFLFIIINGEVQHE